MADERQRLLRRIAALRERRVDRGCTQAEAEAARAMLKKLEAQLADHSVSSVFGRSGRTSKTQYVRATVTTSNEGDVWFINPGGWFVHRNEGAKRYKVHGQGKWEPTGPNVALLWDHFCEEAKAREDAEPGLRAVHLGQSVSGGKPCFFHHMVADHGPTLVLMFFDQPEIEMDVLEAQNALTAWGMTITRLLREIYACPSGSWT